MKTVFDTATRADLINRISLLTDAHVAQWGKMNAFQMVRHCILFEEMLLGKKQYKQVFIGRVFGKIALRDFMKEKPIKPNMPTANGLRITEKSGDIALEITKWINLMEEYGQFANPNFIHPFFGKMTAEQIGYLQYKHTDHHLRQFKA